VATECGKKVENDPHESEVVRCSEKQY